MWTIIILLLISFVIITGLKIEKINVSDDEYDINFNFNLLGKSYRFTLHRRWKDFEDGKGETK